MSNSSYSASVSFPFLYFITLITLLEVPLNINIICARTCSHDFFFSALRKSIVCLTRLCNYESHCCFKSKLSRGPTSKKVCRKNNICLSFNLYSPLLSLSSFLIPTPLFTVYFILFQSFPLQIAV